MSKRAIEKAYDAYPLNESNRYNNEWNAKRVGYQKGYEQAEKDLALTADSMAKIDAIILDVNNEFAVDYSQEISRQKFYEEVLKRFNELKNNERN